MEFNNLISVIILISFATISFSTISLASTSPSASLSESTSESSSKSSSKSPSSAPTASKGVTAKDLCRLTKNPSKCLKFVSPLVQHPAHDSVSALDAIIQGIYQRVERANTIADYASKSPSLTMKMYNSIHLCKKSYKVVMKNLTKALAVTHKHIKSANPLLASAGSHVGECDKSFGKIGEESPLKEIDAAILELIEFSIDISKSLI